MDSLDRLISASKPLPPALTQRALVHASLGTTAAVTRRGRHLTGTFCLTGDTMEGIIQCLVFLKAFSVSYVSNFRFTTRFLRFCLMHYFVYIPWGRTLFSDLDWGTGWSRLLPKTRGHEHEMAVDGDGNGATHFFVARRNETIRKVKLNKCDNNKKLQKNKGTCDKVV